MAYLISFNKGFRIGHKPEFLPPAITCLRAMASVAAMAGDTELLNSILNGDISASVMLPLARYNDGFKPLVHLNRGIAIYFSRYIAEKSGMSFSKKVKPYFTLAAAAALVKSFNASLNEHGWPELRDVAEKLASIVEIKKTEGDEIILCEKREATQLRDINIKIETPKLASEHRNSIDRLTGAAKPFVIAYMSAKNMLLLIDSSTQLDDRVETTLKLLGELGIGGLRSRGLGRFTVERVRLTAEDEQTLGMVVPFSKARHGYLLTLGELPLSNALDWEHSFFETHIIAGYMGPPYAQALYGPLVVTRPGAIVKKGYSEPSPVRSVKFAESVSMSINPLVIVG